MGWRGGRSSRGGRFATGARGSNRRSRPNSSPTHPGRRLRETDVGIAEHVRSGDGFHGLIKTRYADFQVNEIGPKGEFAELTDLSAPKFEEKTETDHGDGELDVLFKYDTDILSVEMWDKINSAALADQHSAQKVEIDVTGMTKEQRTKIHEVVKKVFGRKIIGSTITKSEKKFVVFSTFVKGERTDNREKWRWNGDFVHFVLYKENCDTMEAVSHIAERLNMKHIKPSFFGYSGTKDKRGKTSQWLSIKRVEPIKIINCCKQFRNIKVGNFSFKDYRLKLGDLKGNRFKIALRNVSATNEIVKQAVESLRDKGFINYYGLQRFGSRADIPTHTIGKCLLQGNFKEAVQLILKPHGHYFEYLNIYKKTGSAQIALQGSNYLSHSSPEMKLLHALKKEENNGSPNNFVGALNNIPRNTRLLYIHSYQSLIWNMCVSERLRKFGFSCHVGDLVLINSEYLNEDLADISECLIESDNEDDDVAKNNIKKPSEDNERVKPEDEKTHNTNESKEEKLKEIVKILTEDDILSNTYSITDIIMPLPGFNIIYPPNMVNYYEELLKKDNLNLDLKQKTKTYSLSGTYRYLIKKPENLSWRFAHYSNPTADLILSDLDKICGRNSIDDLPDGKFKGLILEFDLSPSTYATMALRELLKMDTSSEIQAQNNDYYNELLDEEKKPDLSESQSNAEKRKIPAGNDPDLKRPKIEDPN